MGDSESNQTPSPTAPAASANWYFRIGGAFAALGGGALLLHRFTSVNLPDGLYYTALGALIFGIVQWSLGRMEPHAAREWNKSLFFALALATLIRWPIAEPYRIPSGSMETTLHGDPAFGKGDRVFVNKWIYGVRYPFMNKRIWYGAAPQRWDIVVFKSVEPDAEHPTLVKRIVGMPGDRIQIRGGKVYVNNEPLEIPDFMPEGQYYTAGFGMHYGVRNEPEYSVVPEGHYLVLGDNSANSRDGRYFGWLPNEHIVGRVASIWWPPPRWRDFTGFTSSIWWNGTILLLALYLVTRLFIGRSWIVPDASRAGRIHLLVSFLAYGLRVPMTGFHLNHWGKPARHEVVMYRPCGEVAKDYDRLIGRVVGLPGDSIQIDAGRLVVGGEPVAASWLDRPIAALKDHPENDAVTVPEGHVYILTYCPEEETALDSRVMGTVPVKHLIGRAVGAWWPLGTGLPRD